jgi:hypothetical protein
MAAIGVSFRWLDLLEKEFDKAYVDLELLIGKFFFQFITDFVQLVNTSVYDVKTMFEPGP